VTGALRRCQRFVSGGANPIERERFVNVTGSRLPALPVKTMQGTVD
jgi:hypothetical protein